MTTFKNTGSNGKPLSLDMRDEGSGELPQNATHLYPSLCASCYLKILRSVDSNLPASPASQYNISPAPSLFAHPFLPPSDSKGLFTSTNPETRRVLTEADGRVKVKVVYVVLEAQYQSALSQTVKKINATNKEVRDSRTAHLVPNPSIECPPPTHPLPC